MICTPIGKPLAARSIDAVVAGNPLKEAMPAHTPVEGRPECQTRLGAVAPYRLRLRFAREDGDLMLLKPVRRATLPRNYRESGECRVTLSLPSPRSDVHDQSAPT